MIKRSQEVLISPTAFELATEFCEMDADEQAEFFNAIHEITSKTFRQPFVFQLQAVTDSTALTDDGRSIMDAIGNYSQKLSGD